MRKSRKSVYAFSLFCTTILASCHKDDDGDTAAAPSDDATIGAFSELEFEASQAASLNVSSLEAAVKNIDLPKPISFVDGKSPPQLSLRKTLGLRASGCSEDSSVTDVITAKGPILTLKIVKDSSECLAADLEQEGFSVSISRVITSAKFDLVCPEANFDKLDGRSLADIKAKKEVDLLNCRYTGPKAIKFRSVVRADASVVGKTAEESDFTYANKGLWARFGKEGHCVLENEGGGLLYKDCIDATNHEVKIVDGTALNRDVDIVAKITLDGLRSDNRSSYFSSSTSVPFVLNDWSGTLTFSGYSGARYKLSNGTEARTGTLE